MLFLEGNGSHWFGPGKNSAQIAPQLLESCRRHFPGVGPWPNPRGLRLVAVTPDDCYDSWRAYFEWSALATGLEERDAQLAQQNPSWPCCSGDSCHGWPDGRGAVEREQEFGARDAPNRTGH